jgi:hypothetical protein
MANSAINEVAYPLYKSPCCEADETISTVHWELQVLIVPDGFFIKYDQQQPT